MIKYWLGAAIFKVPFCKTRSLILGNICWFRLIIIVLVCVTLDRICLAQNVTKSITFKLLVFIYSFRFLIMLALLGWISLALALAVSIFIPIFSISTPYA